MLKKIQIILLVVLASFYALSAANAQSSSAGASFNATTKESKAPVPAPQEAKNSAPSNATESRELVQASSNATTALGANAPEPMTNTNSSTPAGTLPPVSTSTSPNATLNSAPNSKTIDIPAPTGLSTTQAPSLNAPNQNATGNLTPPSVSFNTQDISGVNATASSAAGNNTAAALNKNLESSMNNSTIPASADFFSSPIVPTQVDSSGSKYLVKLTNGLPVLIVPDNRFPLVSLRLYVHAGSAYETPKQAGLSHLLEHMVFKGTDKRPKGTIAKEVESLGGYINAATSFDYTVYHIDMPSKDWQKGLDIITDMALHPRLAPEDVTSEKKVVISELERGEDDPASYMFKQMQAEALTGTPYERPIIGFKETVSSFTSQDLKNYIATWYQPQSMLLVICGNIKPEETLKEANALLGGLVNMRPYAAPPSINPATLGGEAQTETGATVPAGPRFLLESRPLNKVYLQAAIPVTGYAAGNDHKYELLARLLGGDNTSLFYRKYKYETQLVDAISVDFYSFERIGLIYIGVLVDASKFDAFWDKFSKDLPKLSSASFTEKDLARSKLNIEDELFRAKETISGLANKVGLMYFQSNSLNGEKDYLEALRGTTLVDLQKLIDTSFKPELFNTVVLTPKDFTPKDLSTSLKASWKSKSEEKPADQTSNGPKQEVVYVSDSKTLILMPDKTLPYVSVNISYNGGDLLLSQNEQGLDDLAVTILTKSTKKKTAPQMEVFLSERAASLSGGAAKQTFTISSFFPSKFSADMFGLLKEVLTQPSFNPKEIEREKETQIALIKSNEDQPFGLISRKLTPFLFPNQIQGYQRFGEVDQVAKFTGKQLSAYWKMQAAKPQVIAVTGDFNRDEIIKFAQSLPATSEVKPEMPELVWNKEHTLNITAPARNQTHILMLFKTDTEKSVDNPKLALLNTILSGQGGLLFKELRDEQGLGYTVTSFKTSSSGFGMIGFYIGTEPKNADKAIAGFKSVIKQLQTTLIAPELLTAGCAQMEGTYYRAYQSMGSRSNEAADLTLKGYPLDFNTKTIEDAKKVTPEELQKIAQKYFIVDDAYIMRIDP